MDCPSDTNCKLLLLDDNLNAGAIDGLPEPVQAEIKEQGFTITSHTFQIQYAQLSSDEVLRVRSAELGRGGPGQRSSHCRHQTGCLGSPAKTHGGIRGMEAVPWKPLTSSTACRKFYQNMLKFQDRLKRSDTSRISICGLGTFHTNMLLAKFALTRTHPSRRL